MRARWFLFAASAAMVPVLQGCHLPEYLGTAEGQQAASDALSGAAGVAANPANPFAWYDLIVGGALLALGGAGVVGGAKGGGKAVRAVGAIVKKHVLNPEAPKAA